MSRGPGHVQRAVLDYLSTEPAGKRPSGAAEAIPLSQVAMAVFSTQRPTASQLASTRRALRQLIAAGSVRDFGRESTFCTDYERRYRQYRYGESPHSRCQLGAPYHEVYVSERWVSRAWTDDERREDDRKVREFLAGFGRRKRSSPGTRSEQRTLRGEAAT